MIYGVDVDEDDHDDDEMIMVMMVVVEVVMMVMMMVMVLLLWRNSWMSGLPESGQVYEAGGDHRTAPNTNAQQHWRHSALNIAQKDTVQRICTEKHALKTCTTRG